MGSLKLKKHESFYIREGWFEKAINVIKDNDTNIFYKNDGITYLGIGSNMVKGLKYWLKAANIIEGLNNNLTPFAELLYENDRYLDDLFSWSLIHYYLATNKEDCPVIFEMFNAGFTAFEKQGAIEYLMNQFRRIDSKVKQQYVDADFNVYTKSYINDDIFSNPEENYICPLSRLKLMKKEKDVYRMMKPAYTALSYLVVYYALLNLYAGKPFEIEESMNAINSPVRIFNLDKYMYLQYLDEARKNELITINRTAGLNTVYFEKELSLSDLFNEQYGGKK